MAKQRAIAAVLAGGRGERLGNDKPAALLAGKPLVRRPLEAAARAGLEAIVVAKPDTELPALEQTIVREPANPRHPLCGALAAIEHAARLADVDAVLLLACDMPFLAAGLLSWLASQRGAALASLGGRMQPLPARIPVSAGSSLRRSLEQRSSLTEAFRALSPRVLEEGELARFGNPARLLFNVNDERDLQTACAWLEPAVR